MLDNERTGLAFRLLKRTLVAPHAARRNGYATETVVFACNHGRKSLMASSRTTRSRLCRHRRRYILAKLCALIVCAAFLCLWNVRDREARFRLQNADLHEMIKHSNQNHDQHPLSRCVDADDNRSSLVTCSCPDPLTETADSNWKFAEHHRRMVTAAQGAHQMDVVFLGDSITERWNGTKSRGSSVLDDHKLVFDKHFPKAIALGSAGDISTQLLWHLKHGVLNDALNPKVFVVLIGTNDLGVAGCSKRTILSAILNIATFLHDHRPDSAILLHGLLPRGGSFVRGKRRALGQYWDDIVWINRALKKLCSVHKGDWFYMETVELFLDGNMTSEQTLTDSLHPSLDGYTQWAPLIESQVAKIIKHREQKTDIT